MTAVVKKRLSLPKIKSLQPASNSEGSNASNYLSKVSSVDSANTANVTNSDKLSNKPTADTDLAIVIKVWSQLTDSIRSAILAEKPSVTAKKLEFSRQV